MKQTSAETQSHSGENQRLHTSVTSDERDRGCSLGHGGVQMVSISACP